MGRSRTVTLETLACRTAMQDASRRQSADLTFLIHKSQHRRNHKNSECSKRPLSLTLPQLTIRGEIVVVWHVSGQTFCAAGMPRSCAKSSCNTCMLTYIL
ncbi:hypothetical protein CC80DRAFT_498158 [Byssothecium circinans]|uniref:Uncharacterized protein n=1 Tax=Byssothecium circinans TaxID=147558 RepID=A0A6A5T9V8_9PLEO|nr:hypothetical protein CC80DRAFT_498158 [Byssothecium circinans]